MLCCHPHWLAQEGSGLDAGTIRAARAEQPSSGSIPVVVAGGDAAAVREGGADGVAVRFDQLAPAAAAFSGREPDTPASQARGALAHTSILSPPRAYFYNRGRLCLVVLRQSAQMSEQCDVVPEGWSMA